MTLVAPKSSPTPPQVCAQLGEERLGQQRRPDHIGGQHLRESLHACNGGVIVSQPAT